MKKTDNTTYLARPKGKPDMTTKGKLNEWSNGYREFIPQGTRENQRELLKQLGDSRFYKTNGKKDSSWSVHLNCDGKSEDPVGELLMYAGTSRAKYRLCCLINMSEEECRQVLQQRRERRPEKERDKEEPDLKRVRNIYAFFAKELNGELVTKAQRR